MSFKAFGCSAVDDSDGSVRGRPYGGLGVLIRKSFRPMADLPKYDDSRLLSITFKNNSESLYFLTTYSGGKKNPDLLLFYQKKNKQE